MVLVVDLMGFVFVEYIYNVAQGFGTATETGDTAAVNTIQSSQLL